MRTLDLDRLGTGNLAGLSKNVGAFLAEAAAVSLFLNGHGSGVMLKVSGTFKDDFQIIWSEIPDENTLKNWQDLNETVEYGATAIALLLIDELTEFSYSTRAAQMGVADYLLGKKGSPRDLESSNPAAYLEVSGIWNENIGNSLTMRLNIKKRKVGKLDFQVPVFIIVAEFSVPKAKIIKL